MYQSYLREKKNQTKNLKILNIITNEEELKELCPPHYNNKNYDDTILMLEMPSEIYNKNKQTTFLCLNYRDAKFISNYPHYYEYLTPTQLRFVDKFVNTISQQKDEAHFAENRKDALTPVYGPFNRRTVKIKDETEALNKEYSKIVKTTPRKIHSDRYTQKQKGKKLHSDDDEPAAIDEYDGTLYYYKNGMLTKKRYNNESKPDEYYYDEKDIDPNIILKKNDLFSKKKSE